MKGLPFSWNSVHGCGGSLCSLSTRPRTIMQCVGTVALYQRARLPGTDTAALKVWGIVREWNAPTQTHPCHKDASMLHSGDTRPTSTQPPNTTLCRPVLCMISTWIADPLGRILCWQHRHACDARSQMSELAAAAQRCSFPNALQLSHI